MKIRQVKRKSLIYYKLFGIILLIVGTSVALWGVFSGDWILLPPAAIDLFVGVLYIRIKGTTFMKKGPVTMFPSHSGRPS